MTNGFTSGRGLVGHFDHVFSSMTFEEVSSSFASLVLFCRLSRLQSASADHPPLRVDLPGQFISNPLSISVRSVSLLYHVDSFNRSLRPIPAAQSHRTYLSNEYTLERFKKLEYEVDGWCAALGRMASGSGFEWSGMRWEGELLGGKVLAEQ